MASCFVADLKEEIRLGFQVFKPTSLSAATNLARLQEEKSIATKRLQRLQLNQETTFSKRYRGMFAAIIFPSNDCHQWK